MKTGVVFGAEALIRWLHPEKGLIPPFEFLPFLDGTELEIEVGNWVINEALDQLVEWQAMGIDFEVSVNISSHHLQSPKFYDQLEDSLKRHPNIEPKCLQLEILESSALGDLNRISKIVQSCYKLGVQIALDDFGTGYSSLAHLRSLVAQTVKIDSSFIFDFLDDPSDFAIVEGVIGLSQAFNRDIIAEGIESTEHGIMLLMMGCQHGQGYVIARPMPAQEIPVWLQAYVPNLIWLDYAEFPRNPRERKLQQLKLIYSRWFKRIESNIHANPNDKGNWPTIDLADSHHGVWLKHKKHEELFEPAFIDELERIHHRMHQFANSLFEEYSRGEHEKTQFSLAELEAEYKKIMVALN
jgi:EAL domain-containing protein (putative c-di-GMP-specific phosphodiesterase class I)